MSQHPSTPRLATLNPQTVAEEIVDLVRQHIGRLTFVLAPGVEWHEQKDAQPLQSTLGWSALLLTQYAQTGALGDWTEPMGPRDALLEICSALYGCAGEPGTFGIGALKDAVDGAELDAIGLVVVGAHARAKLAEKGSALTARELAVLAGLTPSSVHNLARKGELTLEGGGVPRVEARRWLSGRGVPGVR